MVVQQWCLVVTFVKEMVLVGEGLLIKILAISDGCGGVDEIRTRYWLHVIHNLASPSPLLILLVSCMLLLHKIQHQQEHPFQGGTHMSCFYPKYYISSFWKNIGLPRTKFFLRLKEYCIFSFWKNLQVNIQ